MFDRRLLPLAYLLLACSGCTTTRLRSNSDDTAVTVGDLEQQQVLDNLARFVYDCNSMPYFSFPNQGSAIVSDQESGGMTPSWGRLGGSGQVTQVTKNAAGGIMGSTVSTLGPQHLGDFLLSTLGLSATGQVSNQQSFTLTPVNDPRKLELMRCAYQLAISSCCPNCAPARNCPDCQARFNTFYTGDPEGKIERSASGAITSDCLKSKCCWFHVGCKKELPKNCECISVGHYCDVYVWVTHEGRDELTKLTLAILDYATHDPPVQLTKTISYNIDQFGLPEKMGSQVGTVSATVAVSERPASLLNISNADAVRIEQVLQERLKKLQARLDELNASAGAAPNNANAANGKAAGGSDPEKTQVVADIDSINRKLDFLSELLRAGPLKEQFYRGSSATITPFSVIPQLQQAINAQTPPAPLPQ